MYNDISCNVLARLSLGMLFILRTQCFRRVDAVSLLLSRDRHSSVMGCGHTVQCVALTHINQFNVFTHCFVGSLCYGLVFHFSFFFPSHPPPPLSPILVPVRLNVLLHPP